MPYALLPPMDARLLAGALLCTPGHDLFKPFQYVIYRWTGGGILVSRMGTLDELMAVGIRIMLAITGTHLVNATIIIRAQKRTGAVLDHIVAIFIQPQEGFDKDRLLHPQVPGDAFDIRGFKTRADGFTTIGAMQAIDVRKGLLMQGRQVLFHALAFFVLQLL